MMLSADSTIGEILSSGEGKKVIDKHMPKFAEEPQLSMVTEMTLRKLASFPIAGDLDDFVDLIDGDLKAIKE